MAMAARTLTQASRDFGMPITTLATLLGPLIEAGEARRPHPTDNGHAFWT